MITLSLWLFACSSDDTANAKLEIRLTDAPGDYEEVNIDVRSIEIHSDEGDLESGWRTLSINPGIYNVLELTNGLDTLLGATELPAGHVSQIRLILGDNNSVKTNGVVTFLKTPSAQTSGLKLKVNADLKPGITYAITLDFDAARSIVAKGNGGFNLKPVIRALSEATSGAIKGIVLPLDAAPAVFAVSTTGDTLATAYTDASGRFLLRALDPGTYTVKVSPKTGYAPTEKIGVSVTLGTVTDAGTISVP
ncbi:DUF4382 domain-containing protein [Chryseolinea sp. Jin1]|uniref:DUF4382 domain-containing protein n=1 Tax=Chryseolinea lacunae TaxID=2801331 RepID=A0ABS1KNY3_9BACT|nr:DUF4382 domain-containing protein [Chryseolinea lacunae]